MLKHRIHLFLLLLSLVSFSLAKTVRVTDFKPDRADATAALQAAFDSGAKVVLVDDPGFEYLIESVDFRGNQEVVFQNNVRVRAMPGKFLPVGASLFRINKISNLVVRGEGNAELTMNKSDYQDATRYARAEWRHTLSMRSSTNIVIRDLTLSNSGGDGIYLGAPACVDVHLENLVLTDHHRQGISVISAENLLIKSCKLINTSGTPPAAGIDFEPNNVKERAVNCVLEDCDIYGNQSYAVHFAIPKTLTTPISITMRDCRIYDNGYGVHFNVGGSQGDEPLQGVINMINCQISTPRGSALTFYSHRVGGVQVNFRDCVIDNRHLTVAPVRMSTRHLTDIGGIDFGNLVIQQKLDQPVFSVASLGVVGIQRLGGSPLIRQEDGQEKAIDLAALSAEHPGLPESKRQFAPAPFEAAGWKPAPGATGKAENPVLVRGRNTFVQYAEVGQSIDLTFQIGWSRGAVNFKVEQLSPAGKKKTFAVKMHEEPFVYTLVAEETGIYQFEFPTAGAGIKVLSNAPGHGYLTSDSGLGMFRCNSNLYFNVPGDLDELMIEVYAEIGEPLAFELYDETGVVRASQDSFSGVKFIIISREPTEKTELWRLKLFKVVEDHRIKLGAPLPPVVFTDPANRLVK